MRGGATTITDMDDEKTVAIVAAAKETFLNRGFDAASMDQIAMRANVSKRTVYNRFRSKEDLFGAAIMETCRNLLPVNVDDIEASLPPRAFIRQLCLQFVSEALKPEAIALKRIATFEAARNPAIGMAYLEYGPQWMVDHSGPIVKRLIDKGVLEIDDTVDAIWRLGALITEPLNTRVLMGDVPENLEDAISLQVDRGLDAFMKLYGT